MVDSYADHSVVTAILLQQKENMLALENELNAEIAAISTRDADKLTESANAKLILLEKIQKKDKQLQSCSLAQMTIESEDIAALVEEIKTLLSHCQQQNEINAHAAHQTSIAVNKVKDILLGANKVLTYGKKGAAEGGSLLGKGIKA